MVRFPSRVKDCSLLLSFPLSILYDGYLVLYFEIKNQWSHASTPSRASMTYTKTALLSYLYGGQTCVTIWSLSVCRAHFCGRVAVVLFADWWPRRNESQRLPETVCTNVPNHGIEQAAICRCYHGGGVNWRRINFVGFVNWRSIFQWRYRSIGLEWNNFLTSVGGWFPSFDTYHEYSTDFSPFISLSVGVWTPPPRPLDSGEGKNLW
jgi:hypothetical protein